MKKEERYLFPADYMADPSVHVFNGRLYIYPSHDRESGIPENDNGDHFDMNDYHVLSTDDVMHGEIVDHGVALKVADIPCCLLYTSPSPRDVEESRMPSSA